MACWHVANWQCAKISVVLGFVASADVLQSHNMGGTFNIMCTCTTHTIMAEQSAVGQTHILLASYNLKVASEPGGQLAPRSADSMPWGLRSAALTFWLQILHLVFWDTTSVITCVLATLSVRQCYLVPIQFNTDLQYIPYITARPQALRLHCKKESRICFHRWVVADRVDRYVYTLRNDAWGIKVDTEFCHMPYASLQHMWVICTQYDLIILK